MGAAIPAVTPAFEAGASLRSSVRSYKPCAAARTGRTYARSACARHSRPAGRRPAVAVGLGAPGHSTCPSSDCWAHCRRRRAPAPLLKPPCACVWAAAQRGGRPAPGSCVFSCCAAAGSCPRCAAAAAEGCSWWRANQRTTTARSHAPPPASSIRHAGVRRALGCGRLTQAARLTLGLEERQDVAWRAEGGGRKASLVGRPAAARRPARCVADGQQARGAGSSSDHLRDDPQRLAVGPTPVSLAGASHLGWTRVRLLADGGPLAARGGRGRAAAAAVRGRNGAARAPRSPSRTGPFTLRMIRRFWSSRNLTRTCVTCGAGGRGTAERRQTETARAAAARAGALLTGSAPGHGSRCGR